MLTLRVLRTLACFVTSVLLALDFARIACEHPALAQSRTQRLGAREQRPRDTVADRIGLGRTAPALDGDQSVELTHRFGHLERLHHAHPRRGPAEVFLERAL